MKCCLIFSFLSDYLSSELQAMRMIGGDEDKMEIDDEVYSQVAFSVIITFY